MIEPELTECDNEDEVHAGFADTGDRGVNPLTGSEFEIWACACGDKTLEVFPQYAPSTEDA